MVSCSFGQPDHPIPAEDDQLPYWLNPGGVRGQSRPRKIAKPFSKLGTSSPGFRLCICMNSEKKVLGMIRRSCILCLGHLKVKRSSYKILDLPTSPSHVWGRSAGFRSMPKDFCCFENVIGSGWIVFLFIYKELGGSASSSRGQHHPECLFGLRSGQVKERWSPRKIATFSFHSEYS